VHDAHHLQKRGSHADHRFDSVARDFAQRTLDDTGDERERGDDKGPPRPATKPRPAMPTMS
jgi:hypothetical protein